MPMKTCPVCDTPFPDQHKNCPTDGAVLLASLDLPPGHIVRGKYRIVSKLGQGGMGVVYLAEHQMLGGQVALKFLASELSRNPQFVKRFRNEARAAYQLRHPNIVEVTDLDQEEDGSLFIAMEHVAGPSLRSALQEAKGPLPVERALRIARGVAAGLVAAHARGAVHRDIKPENILLAIQPDGQELAKVLDFGIAVMTEGITGMSSTHGLLLTPEFAAPEQWRGTPAAELDGRTDLYALGGVLYEMLAGRTPFLAVNPEGWMFQHLQGVPEPLENLRPDLSREYPELDSVVMRLLARERDQRFPSAAAALEALTPMPLQPVPAEKVQTVSLPPPPPILPPKPAPTLIPADPRPEPIPSFGPSAPRTRFPRWIAWSALVAVALAILLVAVLFRSSSVTATPALAPKGGQYPGPQVITIADATPGATIHYTIDGSSPNEQSPVYSQPLTGLPSGAVLRAIAVAAGSKTSPDITGVYIWSGTAPSQPASQDGSLYDQAKSSYDHKQYAQARTLFAQSCDSGELRACNYLGYLYAQGLGGPTSVPNAREAYQKACDGGKLSSCASLGSLYQDGGNTAVARKYFKQACDGGLAEGCTLLKGAQ
jgi:serine/threonine-protein kinase